MDSSPRPRRRFARWQTTKKAFVFDENGRSSASENKVQRETEQVKKSSFVRNAESSSEAGSRDESHLVDWPQPQELIETDGNTSGETLLPKGRYNHDCSGLQVGTSADSSMNSFSKNGLSSQAHKKHQISTRSDICGVLLESVRNTINSQSSHKTSYNKSVIEESSASKCQGHQIKSRTSTSASKILELPFTFDNLLKATQTYTIKERISISQEIVSSNIQNTEMMPNEGSKLKRQAGSDEGSFFDIESNEMLIVNGNNAQCQSPVKKSKHNSLRSLPSSVEENLGTNKAADLSTNKMDKIISNISTSMQVITNKSISVPDTKQNTSRGRLGKAESPSSDVSFAINSCAASRPPLQIDEMFPKATAGESIYPAPLSKKGPRNETRGPATTTDKKQNTSRGRLGKAESPSSDVSFAFSSYAASPPPLQIEEVFPEETAGDSICLASPTNKGPRKKTRGPASTTLHESSNSDDGSLVSHNFTSNQLSSKKTYSVKRQNRNKSYVSRTKSYLSTPKPDAESKHNNKQTSQDQENDSFSRRSGLRDRSLLATPEEMQINRMYPQHFLSQKLRNTSLQAMTYKPPISVPDKKHNTSCRHVTKAQPSVSDISLILASMATRSPSPQIEENNKGSRNLASATKKDNKKTHCAESSRSQESLNAHNQSFSTQTLTGESIRPASPTKEKPRKKARGLASTTLQEASNSHDVSLVSHNLTSSQLSQKTSVERHKGTKSQASSAKSHVSSPKPGAESKRKEQACHNQENESHNGRSLRDRSLLPTPVEMQISRQYPVHFLLGRGLKVGTQPVVDSVTARKSSVPITDVFVSHAKPKISNRLQKAVSKSVKSGEGLKHKKHTFLNQMNESSSNRQGLRDHNFLSAAADVQQTLQYPASFLAKTTHRTKDKSSADEKNKRKQKMKKNSSNETTLHDKSQEQADDRTRQVAKKRTPDKDDLLLIREFMTGYSQLMQAYAKRKK